MEMVFYSIFLELDGIVYVIEVEVLEGIVGLVVVELGFGCVKFIDIDGVGAKISGAFYGVVVQLCVFGVFKLNVGLVGVVVFEVYQIFFEVDVVAGVQEDVGVVVGQCNLVFGDIVFVKVCCIGKGVFINEDIGQFIVCFSFKVDMVIVYLGVQGIILDQFYIGLIYGYIIVVEYFEEVLVIIGCMYVNIVIVD